MGCTFKVERHMALRDWVHDVAIVRATLNVSSDDNEDVQERLICIAFAHNFAEAYRLHDDDDDDSKPMHSIQCSVRCILYAARFHGAATDDLLLASGTVFNEVLLWRVFGERDDRGDAHVLKKFVGHEVCKEVSMQRCFLLCNDNLVLPFPRA